MIGYIARRIAYGFAVLLGVNLLTFMLFFAVNTPDDMARLSLGGRHVTPEAIERWKAARGYDAPLFFNGAGEGLGKLTQTVFWRRSAPLLKGELGLSDAGRSINQEIRERAGPSLALALPTFLLGVVVMVSFSLLLVLVRRTRLERAGLALSVA
ncbi:MAG: ABC transporter permease, partial [Duodenibacillus sp.]|nr:ABC transporter permease [Duodenibacillus sp.]